MSYDVYLRGCYGCGDCPSCHAAESELDRNYTYNVGPMIHDACGSGPNEWHGKPANEVASIISKGLEKMRADPAKYEAMNPANGWGDFEGCKNFLGEIQDECQRYPKAFFASH